MNVPRPEDVEALIPQERRSDPTVRDQVTELLALIRDFYSTCHMVAVGQLEPSKAKNKASELEERLGVLMGDMLERVEDEAGADTDEAAGPSD